MPGSGLDIRLYPDVLRSINSTTFTGSYQKVGTALAYPVRIVKFMNLSGVDVTVSWDGVNDHDVIAAGGFLLLDVSSNRETANQCTIAAGTQFYVKASASTGLFYISVYYAT